MSIDAAVARVILAPSLISLWLDSLSATSGLRGKLVRPTSPTAPERPDSKSGRGDVLKEKSEKYPTVRHIANCSILSEKSRRY